MTRKNAIITLSSLTHAIKAKKLLSEYGIDARVVKPDTQRAEKGCGYGVSVDATVRESAEKLLRENGIPPLDIK